MYCQQHVDRLLHLLVRDDGRGRPDAGDVGPDAAGVGAKYLVTIETSAVAHVQGRHAADW
jgi:hypothetical protein